MGQNNPFMEKPKDTFEIVLNNSQRGSEFTANKSCGSAGTKECNQNLAHPGSSDSASDPSLV